ncbi:hypothetical protein GEMRC1_006965 [Eukaryota sp. GEM-RC1]
MISDDGKFVQLMAAAQKVGARVSLHAENVGILESNLEQMERNNELADPYNHYRSRDEICELEAVKRALYLADTANTPLYIVHLAVGEGVDEFVRMRAQKGRLDLVAETCAQYLAFNRDVYKREDARNFICSPPIKAQESQDMLWEGIRKGIISTVASDHCPFQSYEKDWGKNDFRKVPNGLCGLENTYPFMLSEANKGTISFNKAVEVCSTNVAKEFGIPNKGDIVPGFDADFVIYDPTIDFTVTLDSMHSNVDHTVWEGVKLKGYPIMTFSRGVLSFDHGKFVGEQGHGNFVERIPFNW